jgi:effector-binding domain-containing protein
MRTLKRIAAALAIIAGLLAVIGFFLPRQVHMERSTVVAAPASTVFALVNGYKMFNKWSPWHGIDPDAKYTYEGPDSGVGARMTWAGNASVGSGSQEVIESRPGEMVRVKLDFGDQGGGTAQFNLVPEGDGTKVTWGFDTDLGMNPISRYFGLMIDGMVGKDYEKGLAGLKTLAESLPKADFSGLEVEVVEAAPVTVAFVPAECGKDEQEIARAIGGAYAQVGQFMSKNRLKQAAAPITINKKWDASGYQFDAAIPVDRTPEGAVPADSPVQVKQTYAGKALKVVHRGPYRNMPASYDKLQAYLAAHGYETAGPPWDEYVTDPGSTPEPDLVTHIFMPIR